MKILVVAAHPDDEILGCSGTVAILTGRGHEVRTIVMGEGVTSRVDPDQREGCGGQIVQLREQLVQANKIVGVEKLYIHEFPDNRFDTVPLLDLIKVVEGVKQEFKPDIVFTHFGGDLNIDHRITHEAVLAATRPLKSETVTEVFSFEVLSSTEWAYPTSFSPDCFYDISETIEIKMAAVGTYTEELCQSPHPRSLEGIRMNARHWGMKIGVEFAEAFKVVRIIR